MDDGRSLVLIKVVVLDGSYHEVDSDEQSFAIAASIALQDALRRAEFVEA